MIIKLTPTVSSALVTTGATPGSATLASGARALSAVYDNSAGLYLFADFEFVGSFSVSPTSGDQILLYLIPANNGTDYTDGSDTVSPANNLAIGWFAARNTTNPQRLTARGAVGQRIELPPTKFMILVANLTGQQIASSWSLTMFLYGLQA